MFKRERDKLVNASPEHKEFIIPLSNNQIF